MRVGVPTEIKPDERRVGLTTASVTELTRRGHEVLVQAGAGAGVGSSDDEYRDAGGRIVETADEVFATADLVVKVKEPQPEERRRLRRGQLLFTYLHLAPDPEQTADLLASEVTAVAYETVTGEQVRLPLLAPMSQVAGRLSIQAGAHVLEAPNGGAGVLLGGVPGVAPARVVVIGGGVVGVNAVQMAIGLGAEVTVLDRELAVLDRLAHRFGPALRTLYSTTSSITDAVTTADLVVGAVLIPGARAPRLLSEELIARMRPRSVLVDVAIDQGGCFETSRPTTHRDPVYIEHDVVHYCVANMPGAVPRTSSHALNNATLPYVLALAEHGLEAVANDPHLRAGLNVHAGMVAERHVAEELGYDYVPPVEALEETGRR